MQETVWLGDVPVAVLTGSGVGAAASYIHADHLNAPKVITDQIGNAVWNWDHDPFGNGQPTGTFTYNLRFPGQYYDMESGLNYNLNRDYDPALGRYVESDPIGLEGGINTYGYVGQNPLWAVDPEGLDWIFDRGTGRLSHANTSGNTTGTWIATSGPYGKGQLPAGEYRLSSPPVRVPPSHPKQSSYCDRSGNCWWQPVVPMFSTKRTSLGIHPDGGVSGTLGCIGAEDADTSSLFEALANHPEKLTVR